MLEIDEVTTDASLSMGMLPTTESTMVLNPDLWCYLVTARLQALSQITLDVDVVYTKVVALNVI
jgi:hypothetical protein